MVGVSVIAVLCRAIAVASAPIARAVIDSVLIAVLLRGIRSVTAVASIAATAPAATATIIPVSISIAVPAPTAIAIAAILLEAALIS